MSDYVSVKVYKILQERVTSFVSYQSNSKRKLTASEFKIVLHDNMKLRKNSINCDTEKLNFNFFFSEENYMDDNTDSVVVEELPPDAESKTVNFPTFTNCQNCETNFPTKYQYQRHQCDFNAEKIVLKSSLSSNSIDSEQLHILKFECHICGKKFVNLKSLNLHEHEHHEKLDESVCEHCNKHFVTENRLRIHKENHCKKAGGVSKFYRSDVTVWKCKRCHEVFSSQEIGNYHASVCREVIDLYEHHQTHEDETDAATNFIFNEEGITMKKIMNRHNENRCVEKILTELLLQCEFCNRTYADKNLLLMHQRKHNTERNYECVNCSRIFDSYITASSHWLQKCSEYANLFYLPKLTFCEYCDRTFKSHEILYNHKVKKRHYTPKLHFGIGFDKENVPPRSNKNHTSITEDIIKQLQIPANGSEQEHPENLSLRIKSEPTSENSSCVSMSQGDDPDNPSVKKPKSSKVQSSYPTIDEGFKYQCQMCIKVFDSISTLENHRSTEHTANFRCDDCGQTLHTIKALLIHSRAHKSLKPYVCDTCERSYSQTSHLWQHMRFHQGIKPFACPHEGCEARYTIRPDLKDHIRKVHTRERPFKCNVCNKCFLTGSVYYQHRLIHTNDRRYGCDICQKRFFRADALNNHRRIHTDERPYPCVTCGREFRQKGDRNKHMRTQHANC